MEDEQFTPEQIKKGVRITPEIIEKIKAAKSSTEMMELFKGHGIEMDEVAAEKWFEKLKSGEHAAKELSVVANNGGCGARKCPQCGGPHCYQRYLSTGLGTGNVIVWCEDCGYEKTYM